MTRVLHEAMKVVERLLQKYKRQELIVKTRKLVEW